MTNITVCFPFLQMGWLHVPRLQRAPVHLRARRVQALEWLGGSRSPDPVCQTCAGHAVAQERLLHCHRPRPSSRSRPWPRPRPSTSCTPCNSWSQLSRISSPASQTPPSHSLPHSCQQCLPSAFNLTMANAACAQWGVPCMFQWRIKSCLTWSRPCLLVMSYLCIKVEMALTEVVNLEKPLSELTSMWK